MATEPEIAFAMPRYRPILDSGLTFTDQDGLDDPTVVVCFLGVMARAPLVPGASRMLQQFLFHGAVCLDSDSSAVRDPNFCFRSVSR